MAHILLLTLAAFGVLGIIISIPLVFFLIAFVRNWKRDMAPYLNKNLSKRELLIILKSYFHL